MKKLTLLLIAAIFAFVETMAIPAYPVPMKVTQPDGTTVMIVGHGDEYHHFTTTDDGYTVVKDNQGFFVYARLNAEGNLVPTAMIAHEAGMRNSREMAFLQTTEKMIAPVMKETVKEAKNAEKARRAKALSQRRAAEYDYSKFHGLILLVEYKDRSFIYENYKDIMEDMVNKENYQGTKETNSMIAGQYYAKCSGSVFDYYRDNSNGVFQPKFDIVGPIKVNESQSYPKGTANASELIVKAVDAADAAGVDFSKYDTDNDGVVDMVYFVFAGAGANVGSNNQDYLWPHAAFIYRPLNYYPYGEYIYKDGKQLGRYACGVEQYGEESMKVLDGIGTICHEFSHVLGLPDFYDADYTESGGQAVTPGSWSLMDAGCYLNCSRTPSGYSLFERYALGFIPQPTVINGIGHHELKALNTSNQGYRLNSPAKKEFFFIENRQQTGWDEYLPGHGMLIYRVDSTSASIWNNNQVNNNPDHTYYTLLRAKGYNQYTGEGDPFPGSGRVTSIDNYTKPANLLSWAGVQSKWGLEKITEKNGVISFDVFDASALRSLSLPEQITLGVGVKMTLTPTAVPDYATYTPSWTTDNPAVAVVDQLGSVRTLSVGEANITISAKASATSSEMITATCKIIVKDMTVAENIAAMKTLADGTELLLTLNNAEVTYNHTANNNIYIRDASGACVLNGTSLSANAGDIINGAIIVKYAPSQLMPIATKSANTDLSSVNIAAGNAPAPHDLFVRDLTADNYADLVNLKECQVERETIGGKTYVVAYYGNKKVIIYNVFGVKGITIPKTFTNKFFDIPGILGTTLITSTNEIMSELYLTGSFTEVESTGIKNITTASEATELNYSLDGLRLQKSQRGINIVRSTDGTVRKVVVK